jgi:two-component system, chemotaxis family, sensor kinase CheA
LNLDEYKDIFLAESREYLQTMNQSLLALESTPDDQESVQQVFRSAHSLKGMAGTMGYEMITQLTHSMENVLQDLREGNLQFNSTLADILFQCLDALEQMLLEIESGEEAQIQISDLLKKLRTLEQSPCVSAEVSEADTEVERENSNWIPQLEIYEHEILKESVDQHEKVYAARVVLREDTLLKSVRAYMVFRVVEEGGTLIKTAPAVQEIEEDNFGDEFAFVFTSRLEPEEILPKIESISDVETVVLVELESPAVQNESGVNEGTMDPAQSEKKASTKKMGSKQEHKEKTVRVETNKLDILINLVGELVINRTRIIEISKSSERGGLTEASESLDRITSEMQSAIMKLRMVPIKQVFDRFPRMVRDLAKENGKGVNLTIRGEETELDRSIVNQIGDPLVHIIRNAIDHGIEAEDEREKQGKDPCGRIVIEARHEGSYIAVEVEDDGCGLDPEKIKASAIRKGMISNEEAVHLSTEQTYQLIFRNGFSTAEMVTDISGRGVGMDAVKKIVEDLNGLIDIDSQPGKGTRITLRLPLTLAIIRALLVSTHNQILAIPVENVTQNLLISPQDIRYVNNQKAITVREEIVPLLDLDELLAGKCSPAGDVKQDVAVVIVGTGERKAGLVVNQLLGQQEVVIKSLGSMLGKLKGIAGATVLGDGRVALILNIATLI